jgi:hypothetical protein
MKYTDLISENITTIDNLLDNFKREYSAIIKYGCKRDNCGVPAGELQMYGKKYGFDIPRVYGFFKVDIPQLSIKDFTKDEIDKMKKQGFDPRNKDDRKSFAEKNNLIDELKHIPHYWNTYNGEIIDFTGYEQFVKTKHSSDTNRERYITV